MPLTNPTAAIKHLYPGIKDSQFSFKKNREGIVLEWIDPAIEPDKESYPAHAELESAEQAWTPPSILDGGAREPTSAELDANRTLADIYYKLKIQTMLDEEAGFYGFGSPKINPLTKRLEFVADINSAAKYTAIAGPFRANASKLALWASDVWAEAARIDAQWKGGAIQAPSWGELRALLPPAPSRTS